MECRGSHYVVRDAFAGRPGLRGSRARDRGELTRTLAPLPNLTPADELLAREPRQCESGLPFGARGDLVRHAASRFQPQPEQTAAHGLPITF